MALKDDDQAIASLERALEREAEFPNARTEATLSYPLLIAVRRRRDKYTRAVELLHKPETLLFPLQVFMREAASALISADLGDRDTARQHALVALKSAASATSGLRYHPDVGLVGSEYDSVRASLEALISR